MNKKYILLDLDGTITDSAEGIINCVKYALEQTESDMLPMHTLRRFIGPPLVDAFMEYSNMGREKALLAVSKYRERYKDIGIFECSVYNGIPKLLRTLKNKNKQLILATAKPHVFANRILKHFNLDTYFLGVVGAEFDGSLNYKHQIIAEAIKRYSISDLSEAIMVGDREQDISGAKTCGIESIGVKYGFAEENELESAGADYIAETPSDVAKLILG